MVVQRRLKCTTTFAAYVASALLLDAVIAQLGQSVSLVDMALVLAAQLILAVMPFAEGGEGRGVCVPFLAAMSAVYLFVAAVLFSLALLLGGVDVPPIASYRHL